MFGLIGDSISNVCICFFVEPEKAVIKQRNAAIDGLTLIIVPFPLKN